MFEKLLAAAVSLIYYDTLSYCRNDSNRTDCAVSHQGIFFCVSTSFNFFYQRSKPDNI